MFEGSKGRFLVNRARIVGRPVEDLPQSPLPEDAYAKLYFEPSTPELGGLGDDGYHMKNFMECIKTRQTPASDVQSHNRMLNVCHAINVAMRLGRPVTYDPKSENFGDDQQANADFRTCVPVYCLDCISTSAIKASSSIMAKMRIQ